MTTVLTLKGIHLFRQGKKVLKNFSLRISKNENWILLGPNGSGKSSLISLLQGHLWPLQGQVSVLHKTFGKDDITEIRKVIGWVGNELEGKFMQKDTALDIIQSGAVGTLGLKFDQPSPEQKKRVNLIVKEMNLNPLIKKPFYNLSQGERRLICIARALMTEPEILMLDEACAGLDPVAREEFLTRLEGLSPGGKAPAILSATHHVEEIRRPFTHCLMLDKGSVFKAGKIREVLTSENLSYLFKKNISLGKSGGRYRLKLN